MVHRETDRVKRRIGGAVRIFKKIMKTLGGILRRISSAFLREFVKISAFKGHVCYQLTRVQNVEFMSISFPSFLASLQLTLVSSHQIHEEED